MIQQKLPTCGWTCPTVVGIIWNLPISSLFWANLCQIWECPQTSKDPCTIPPHPSASLVQSWWQVVTTTMVVILSRNSLKFLMWRRPGGWPAPTPSGSLLKGIDNCPGAAVKAVGLLWTTSFSNNFSLFQLLELFNFYTQCWSYIWFLIKSVLLRRKHK